MHDLTHSENSTASTEAAPSLAAKQRRSRSSAPRILARSVRRAEDTALGCRNLADAGLVAAAKMDTANGRARGEASAAVWLVRARLLDRVEASDKARIAAADGQSGTSTAD